MGWPSTSSEHWKGTTVTHVQYVPPLAFSLTLAQGSATMPTNLWCKSAGVAPVYMQHTSSSHEVCTRLIITVPAIRTPSVHHVGAFGNILLVVQGATSTMPVASAWVFITQQAWQRELLFVSYQPAAAAASFVELVAVCALYAVAVTPCYHRQAAAASFGAH